MKTLEIRPPRLDERTSIEAFFRTVLEHTYAKENLDALISDMDAELEGKAHLLDQCFNSGGRMPYFLIALEGGAVVGSIEYNCSSRLILDHMDSAYSHLPEIGTVYVHPDRQGQGISGYLLASIYAAMREKGIDAFHLDSGFKSAQAIWSRKFGKPDHLLKDYWGAGQDHMIWMRSIPEN